MTPSPDFPPLLDADSVNIDRYLGFCELRIRESDSPTAFDHCLNTKGFVVMTHELPAVGQEEGEEEGEEEGGEEEDHLCRLVYPAACTVRLRRSGSNTCKATERLTWSCREGYSPRNEFNTCYKLPDESHTGQHLACKAGAGAPNLVAFDCADYVANDYVEPPGSVDCDSFDTGDLGIELRVNSMSGSSSDYWCEFNASYLNVTCHGSNRPAANCMPTTAWCLKRASRTGGCDAIAHTISCRALQADYADPAPDVEVTVDKIYGKGCRPCIVLPFRSVPTECPDEIYTEPSYDGTFRHAAIHRVKDDFAVDARACEPVRGTAQSEGADLEDHAACQDVAVCLDPPQGYLSWTSIHFSGLAVVNSPIMLTVGDIPKNYVSVPDFTYVAGRNGRQGRVSGLKRDFLGYADGGYGDPLIRMWPEVDPSAELTRLYDIVRDGECQLRERPRFKIIIEELWPDSDEEAIRKHFGPDSLEWWDDLGDDERKRRTTARGFNNYWGDLGTPAKQEQERDERTPALTQEILCNVGSSVWCRWSPTRSGYYRLTGAGAWLVGKQNGNRVWRLSRALDPWRRDLEISDFREDLRSTLDELGIEPEEAGFNEELTELIPWSTGSDANDWLYTDEAELQFRCPPLDVRVSCTSSHIISGNYTETESIGILVREVRVVTRAPNS